jgi:t-SNARE complex subunit (syntaxin)
VGAEFHEDGRTDVTKLIVAFRNFSKAPKNAEGLKTENSFIYRFNITCIIIIIIVVVVVVFIMIIITTTTTLSVHSFIYSV